MSWNELPTVTNLPIEEISHKYAKEVVYADLIQQYISDYTIVIPKKNPSADSALQLKERNTMEVVANKRMGKEEIDCENIYAEPGTIYGYRYYTSQNQCKVLLPKNCIYIRASFRAYHASGFWLFEIYSSFKNKAIWHATGNLSDLTTLENTYDIFKSQLGYTAQTCTGQHYLRCV